MRRWRRWSTVSKVPHNIEGSHRLLCKYTNPKDTAGQSAREMEEVEEKGQKEETEEKEKDEKEMEEEGNLLTVYSTVWSLPSGSSTW